MSFLLGRRGSAGSARHRLAGARDVLFSDDGRESGDIEMTSAAVRRGDTADGRSYGSSGSKGDKDSARSRGTAKLKARTRTETKTTRTTSVGSRSRSCSPGSGRSGRSGSPSSATCLRTSSLSTTRSRKAWLRAGMVPEPEDVDKDPLRIEHWKAATSRSNAYRVLSFNRGRDYAAREIQAQLDDLAKEFGEKVFKCDTTEKAYDAMLDALFVTKTRGENPFKERTGFQPLAYFTRHRMIKYGCYWIPQGKGYWIQYTKITAFGFVVWLVQTVGPVVMFFDQWGEDANLLNHPEVHKLFVWEEMICPGENAKEVGVTFMGCAMLSLLLMILQGYAAREYDSCRALGRLPMNGVWQVMGNFANCWTVFWLSMVSLLSFWCAPGPFDIGKDCTCLCFLLSLDDLSSEAADFLNVEECTFQQNVVAFAVALERCPIDLQDIINRDAKTPSDFWQIRFDKQGRVLNWKSGQPAQCRLEPVAENDTFEEEDAYLRAEQAEVARAIRSRYTLRTLKGSTRHLPGLPVKALNVMWTSCVWFVFAWQFVGPPLWYLLNKPCYPENFDDKDMDGHVD